MIKLVKSRLICFCSHQKVHEEFQMYNVIFYECLLLAPFFIILFLLSLFCTFNNMKWSFLSFTILLQPPNRTGHKPTFT